MRHNVHMMHMMHIMLTMFLLLYKMFYNCQHISSCIRWTKMDGFYLGMMMIMTKSDVFLLCLIRIQIGDDIK